MKTSSWIVGLIVCALTSESLAARNDLHLHQYFIHCSTQATVDSRMGCANQLFEDMMQEMGVLTATAFLNPAETLGLNGFSLGLEGSVVPTNYDEPHWVQAAEGDPSSVLFIPRFQFRKGLPFSVELGTQLSYIPESELFLLGADVKWALNEGFYYIPDLALRISVNHLIGSKEFELTTGGWDVSLSKAFGILDMFSLTPYAGYHMLFVQASSHVVLIDPSIEVLYSGEVQELVFDEVKWDENMFHRFFLGCRFKSHIFEVTLEGIFAANDINTFNFKLGFNF